MEGTTATAREIRVGHWIWPWEDKARSLSRQDTIANPPRELVRNGGEILPRAGRPAETRIEAPSRARSQG
jgi:hypothetical protein